MSVIRQEVNLINKVYTSNSGTGSLYSSISSEKSSIVATNYVSPIFYFEIVAKNVNVTTDRAVVGRANSQFGSITVPHNTTSYTRFRSTAVASSNFSSSFDINIELQDTPNAADISVSSARIIIIDNPTTLTSTETQIEIGGQGGATYTSTSAVALTAPKYWTYTAANWQPAIANSFSAEVTYKTASTNTATITIQQTSDATFTTWSDLTTIVSAVSNTSATRTRVSFTPTDGRHYRIAVKSSTTKSSVTIYNAKVIVDQSVGAGGITNFEPQYLLLNTPDSNATTLQNYQTLYSENTNGVEIVGTHEWAGVTNAYTHAMDSDNASNSAELQDIDNSNTIVTNSTVTGANQQVSSALTMPTSNHQIDTKIDNTTGIVAASRIIVATSVLPQYTISDSTTVSESVTMFMTPPTLGINVNPSNSAYIVPNLNIVVV